MYQLFYVNKFVYYCCMKEEEKRKQNTEKPDLTKLRPVLFWDTKLDMINWTKHKSAVIKRVFERGNDIEKKEIIRFYGKKNVNEILKTDAKLDMIDFVKEL